MGVCLLWLLGAEAAHAEVPTLAGTWSASPLNVTWQLGDWGSACGPRPSGGGEAGGTVTVTERGGELTISGLAQNFATTECWERYPGIQRISHTASPRSYRNVCKTSAGDPRQATLVTTLSATDERMSFDETGQYQFVIEGQNCTASVRRSRTYRLVARAGSAPSTPSAAPTEPAPTPRPTKACENPGLPERLEVRPSRKLMRPGETFEFRTAVLDAAGCVTSGRPTWRVISGPSGLRVAGPGKVTADPGAPESEVTLEVSLADRAVRVLVEIASQQRYDALLQARGLDHSGESKDAAVLRVASESLGAREVVAEDQSPQRTRWFVGISGTAALLLGVLGFWLVRRGRRPAERPPAEGAVRRPGLAKGCPTCREEFGAEAEFCPSDGNRLVAQATLGSGPGGSVCPVCGRGFNPGTLTCPEHHEELVPAAAHAALPRVASTSRSICPLCGTQFAPGTRFCGECGAAVVPIN